MLSAGETLVVEVWPQNPTPPPVTADSAFPAAGSSGASSTGSGAQPGAGSSGQITI